MRVMICRYLSPKLELSLLEKGRITKVTCGVYGLHASLMAGVKRCFEFHGVSGFTMGIVLFP